METYLAVEDSVIVDWDFGITVAMVVCLVIYHELQKWRWEGKLIIIGCPYCNSKPVVEPWHGGGKYKHMISCCASNCHANPSVTGTTRQETVRRWNIRVPATAHEVADE